ncbi:MAG: hypothetical protein H6Q67_1834 [Firmicutes bacterium]|nr:hypothetical protein [Bacillota bacterium]
MDNPYVCKSCDGSKCVNPEARRLGMCWKNNDYHLESREVEYD